jgi:hypothetical protein
MVLPIASQIPKRSIESPIPATLVIGAGQSNCAGWATDISTSTAVTNGYAYEYYPTGAVADEGVFFPLGRSLFGRTQSGPQPAFCQTLAAGGAGAVLWVNASSGGSSMVSAAKATLTGGATVEISGGTWDLADGSNIYLLWCKPLVQSAIKMAQKNGFSIKRIVVVWVQGEQDAGANALSNRTAYAANLTTLVDRFVSDFGISAFLMAKTGGASTPASFTSFMNDIRLAQDDVAAARPSLIPTPFDTANFYDQGKYVDGLHYTAVGYNELGIALANSCLTLIGGGPFKTPPVSKFYELASKFPYIAGWSRIRFTHKSSGTFNCDIYSGLNTPISQTWLDGAGVNPKFSGQSMSWTFSGSDTKQTCLYIHNTSGATTLVPGSGCRLIRMEVLDKGARVGALNFGSGGNLFDRGFEFNDIDLSRFNGLTFVSLPASNLDARVNITNTGIATQTGITYFSLSGVNTPLLDLTNLPNVTTFIQNIAGLSVSSVNSILQALDTNGQTGGTCNISQFLSSVWPASTPTGTGATAKTSLQGKGWTVTTD